jgi:hypothetical protein
MLRRLLNFTRYNAVIVFLLMGACGALFAWNTFGLAQMSMANVDFIRRFGWTGLADGGLLQLIMIVVKGYFSLLFYLGFKACEVELVRRWHGPAAAPGASRNHDEPS